MIGPTPLPAGSTQEIKEAVEAHRAALWEELQKVLEEVLAAQRDEIQKMLEVALVDVIKAGDTISLQAAQGQFVCAETGGPSKENEPFVLTSRADVGPWESWKVDRGTV